MAADAREFVNAAGCNKEIDNISKRILDFAGDPSEDEIFARCIMVFECILKDTMKQVKGMNPSDLELFEVGVEN